MLFVSKLFFLWTTLYFLKNAVHFYLDIFHWKWFATLSPQKLPSRSALILRCSPIQTAVPLSFSCSIRPAWALKLRAQPPWRGRRESPSWKYALQPSTWGDPAQAGRSLGARPPRHHQGEKGHKERGSRLPASGQAWSQPRCSRCRSLHPQTAALSFRCLEGWVPSCRSLLSLLFSALVQRKWIQVS